MNKTTKILLALGLLMAIVIPVTVKELFTDTDFFESSESSRIEYLQPYKIRPETAIQVSDGVSEQSSSRGRVRQAPAYKSSRQLEKINVPMSDFSNEQSESIVPESSNEELNYK